MASPALKLAQQAQQGLATKAAAAGIQEIEAARAARAAETAKRAEKLGKTGFGNGQPHPVIVVSPPRGGLKTRRFKKKRLMSRKYCKKTPCRRMGFTQKASCRPYKNCYTRRK